MCNEGQVSVARCLMSDQVERGCVGDGIMGSHSARAAGFRVGFRHYTAICTIDKARGNEGKEQKVDPPRD
jgi:hypothetical protein